MTQSPDPPAGADSGAKGPPASGNTTVGGVASRHPEQTTLPVLAAPTTGKGLNTIGLALVPLACWRLEDLRFDFGSSFVKPEVKAEFPLLSKMLKECGSPTLSVFGHADPVGNDSFNKTLSNRRAMAIYAMLIRDTARWEKLFSHPFGDDKWGMKFIQVMLAAAGFDPGEIDGVSGSATRDAIKDFQDKKGAGGDPKGEAGKATREKLFLAYMDAVCVDEGGSPLKLEKTDFLGAGEDPDGRADFQGCSEFNPVLVFSKEEDAELSHAKMRPKRDAENVPNRRVLIFLFPPGLKIAPAVWPCPASSLIDKDDGAGAGVCRKRFWPDGDKRRSPQEERREFKNSNTVACSFYDAMARRSPCEVGRITLRLRLLDSMRDPIEFAPYRVKVGSHFKADGKANEQGRLEEGGIPAPSECEVEWGYPGMSDPEEEGGEPKFFFKRKLTLDFDHGAREDQAKHRLLNLGYSPDLELEDNVEAFQRDYEIDPPDGQLTDDTADKLKKVHDAGLTREELEQ